MIDELQEEQASLYALGLLAPAEAAAFESAMRANPELGTLVRDLEETAAALAYSVEQIEPPAHVREKLLGLIQEKKIVRFEPAPRNTSWIGWAVAASFAILTGFLTYDRAQIRHELAELRGKDAVDTMKIATLTSQLANSPISVGAVAWDGKTNRGFLTVQKLPPLAPNQDYQLWVIDPKYPQPVNGGIVRVDEGGNAQLTFSVQMPIRSIDKFAISRERRGGVPQAEGPMVLMSE